MPASFFGFLAIIGFIPIALWNGVRDWTVVGPFIVLSFVLARLTWGMWRQPYRTDRGMIAYFFVLSSLIPLAGRITGPLIIVPGVTCLVAWAALMYPALLRRPFVVVITVLAAWLVMPVLEYVGQLSPTWEIAGGKITSWSTTIDLDGTSAIAFVFGSSLITICIAAFHSASLARANMAAQRQLVAQAWHLKQLLPS